MEVTIDADKSQNRSKRIIWSRKNTPEEKLKQQKRMEEKATWYATNAETTTRQEANAEAIRASNVQGKPLSLASFKTHFLLERFRKTGKLLKQSEVKIPSRGALMLSMAPGFGVNSVFAKPQNDLRWPSSQMSIPVHTMVRLPNSRNIRNCMGKTVTLYS